MLRQPNVPTPEDWVFLGFVARRRVTVANPARGSSSKLVSSDGPFCCLMVLQIASEGWQIVFRSP